MAKQRLTPADLDARLKFILGITLGSILFLTALGIIYGLLFVTQPIGAQSENDKMFFNVLGSIATFITGTLAGILIGNSGAKDIMAAQLQNKEMDAKIHRRIKSLKQKLMRQQHVWQLSQMEQCQKHSQLIQIGIKNNGRTRYSSTFN
jgi:hypothetical protein